MSTDTFPREALNAATVHYPRPRRNGARRRVLVVAALDAFVLVVSVAATLGLATATDAPRAGSAPVLAYPAVVLALLYARADARGRLRPSRLDALAKVLAATSLATMLLLAAEAFVAEPGPAASLAIKEWVLASVCLGTVRVVHARWEMRARASLRCAKRTLLVGAGVVGDRVARHLQALPQLGLLPVGFLDLDQATPGGFGRGFASPHPPGAALAYMQPQAAGATLPVMGRPTDLARVAARTQAQHVIFAFSAAPDRELLPLVRECDRLGLEVSVVPRLFESLTNRIAVEHVGGVPLLALRSVDPNSLPFAIKHAFDRVIAALLLVLGAPLLALLALAVRLSSPGPALFRQRRVGRDGQVFEILKFRTMRVSGEPCSGFRPVAGCAPGGIEGADRRTRIGRLLRRTSLDELPQLFNVLRGEMSLIGPRPERPEFVAMFGASIERYHDRHRVKSGMTGWAQVHGLRGQTSLADRTEWDNYYVSNWSLGLDVKILLKTVTTVFGGNVT